MTVDPAAKGFGADGGWVLMRQDDNGNRFVVARYSDRVRAEAAAAVFEARGHKQLYWVQRPNPGAPPEAPPRAEPEGGDRGASV